MNKRTPEIAETGTKPLFIREDSVKSVDVGERGTGASLQGRLDGCDIDLARRPPPSLPSDVDMRRRPPPRLPADHDRR